MKRIFWYKDVSNGTNTNWIYEMLGWELKPE